MKYMRTTAVTAAVTGMLLTGAMAPANAARPVFQEGLVNVSVGDVTVLEDVNLGIAAGIAANVCGLDVNLLVQQVRDSGSTSCQAGRGQTFTLTQV